MKVNRNTNTAHDTIEVTSAVLKSWHNPPFQRPLRINEKVKSVADIIKEDGGVIPGVVTIGILNDKKYLLDGQHRLKAFEISECKVGYVDVRYYAFDTMAAMGREFVNINSHLTSFRPDDILRGLEAESDSLTLIRKRCPFVGYDMIRRGPKSPILSMSAVLRCWSGSSNETPSSPSTSAAALAEVLTNEDAQVCTDFLLLAEKAWGRDPEYARLWSALNLTICMWLYRRLVLSTYSARIQKLTKDVFRAALSSLSSDPHYLEWLVGRKLSDRDRSPAYNRIKAIMATRLAHELGKNKVVMPQPAWTSHAGGR